MKTFGFINGPSLRKNLNQVYGDITGLQASLLVEKKEDMKICLRKTIIIYIASIIEALLVWKLRESIKDDVVVLNDEWKYANIVTIHIDGAIEVIAGKRKKERKKIDSLDFNGVINVCNNYKIITNKNLIEELHTIRKLRNRLHIGGLQEVQKEYSEKDLNFALETMEKTIDTVQ